MSAVPTVFTGEMQLMNWGESSSNGAWVKFWIAPEDLEAFRHLKCRSGKIAGHRMMAALAEIGEDEQPVPQERSTGPGSESRPTGGALAKLAGMWCSDPSFWEWLLHAYGWKCESADDAAALIRQECNVESRAELDSNTEAQRIFHDRIRIPFMRWKQGVRG